MALAADPAGAGPPPVKFSGSKAKNGPFNKSNVHFELNPGEVRFVYLRAKSTVNGRLPLPVTMAKGGDDPDLALKWFQGSGIERARHHRPGGGRDVHVRPSRRETRYFRWRVKQLTTEASCGFTAISYPDIGNGGVGVNPRGNCG